MEANLIEQGVDLMLYGMGTVFAFLTILVFATSIMSSIVTRFFPELAPAEPRTIVDATNSGSLAPVEPRVLAVIQEAVYLHRAKTK